ncbi:hypothetical protein NDU88_005982 [Pleurodeles waltl]|uniref:Uncharacterized protein n=1 Tax=Pleurodeles waltl TaxID=8319 RepID=A0AAV7SNF7_PLEWA|nr:hypothetical protein NDU88_005982 [Pleurodeles waltl]
MQLRRFPRTAAYAVFRGCRWRLGCGFEPQLIYVACVTLGIFRTASGLPASFTALTLSKREFPPWIGFFCANRAIDFSRDSVWASVEQAGLRCTSASTARRTSGASPRRPETLCTSASSVPLCSRSVS